MSINSSQTTAPIAKIAPTQELRARTQSQEHDAAAKRPEKSDKTNVTLSELTKRSRPTTAATWIMRGSPNCATRWQQVPCALSLRKLLRPWCRTCFSFNRLQAPYGQALPDTHADENVSG